MQAHELALFTALDSTIKTVEAADATLSNLRREPTGGLVGARKTYAMDKTIGGNKVSKVLVEVYIHEQFL
jgi:hypothetical protein